VARLNVVLRPLLVLALTALPAVAQEPPPALTQPVNDFANVIDGASARTLEETILSLERASGDAVVVATVETFKPDYADLEEYAVEMFENRGRGIGQKGKDNGLLVVVAVRDREVRIEVGYELEQFVTDGFAGQVSRLDMVPSFRRGQYGEGLVAGVSRLVDRIAEGRGVQLSDRPAPRVNVRNTGGGGGLLLALFVLFIVLNALRLQWWAWGVLLASAAIDGGLYLLVKDVVVCYRCGAHHRGVGRSGNAPFELTIHERYRQERIRMGKET